RGFLSGFARGWRMGHPSRSRFVNPPWTFGESFPEATWAAVREQAIFDCCKWDVQSEDHSVLADFPLLLEESAWKTIAGYAERLAAEALAAEAELTVRPRLHRALGLPSNVRSALAGSSLARLPGAFARVIRFDFHFTTESWRISEANTDVPGGFIEASGFT